MWVKRLSGRVCVVNVVSTFQTGRPRHKQEVWLCVFHSLPEPISSLLYHSEASGAVSTS